MGNQNMKKFFLRYQVVVVVFFSFFIYAFLTGCEKKESKKNLPAAPTVTIASPLIKDVTNYIYFTGYTEGSESVEIRARVEGFLKSFNFRPGQHVKKGDMLFEIDPRELEAALEEARAGLATKRAGAQLARASYKRKKSAYKERAVSELTVLEAEASLKQAEAEVIGAEAAVEKAKLNLSYTKIYSPVDGRISRNLVDTGNLVGAGGDKTLLAKVIKYDPMYVYFTVDERSLMLYKRHNRDGESEDHRPVVFMALEGDTDYPYKGFVDYKGNEVDRSTGTIMVRAVFENPEYFIMPGLFARVKMPYAVEKDAMLVPDYAFGTDQKGRFLLIAGQDNKVEYRSVETGPLLENGMRVVKKGIEKQDRIIVKGLQKARPGSVVNPVPQNDPENTQGRKQG